MKKMSLDVTSIKNWMLSHGEKLALGIVGLAFLWFAYSAFSRESLDSQYEPTNLQQKASAVTQHVANSRWDPQTQEVRTANYLERARAKEIAPDTLSLKLPFDPPSTDPKAKRGEPKVLPPEEPRVAAGIGVFRVDQPAEGGDKKVGLRAQPWAVVTAVVPYEQQREAFAAALANAVGYSEDQDRPEYLMPVLQRTDVNPSQPDQVDWKDVPVAKDFEKSWAGGSKQELADSEFVHAELTGPLGPLVVGDWGEEVLHPKVLRVGQRRPAAEAEPEAAEAEPEEPAEPSRFGVRSPRREAPRKPAADNKNTKKGAVEPAPHRLVRVFDYTVEPGKYYRYRLIVALRNPNAGKMPHTLEDPAYATKSVLVAEPTPPTEVVRIPHGHGVLAGPVEAGSRHSGPTANFVVTAIDRTTGLTAPIELKEVHRGAAGNTSMTEVPVKHPITGQVTNVELKFDSNFVVLDMHGGESMPGKMRATYPGEILFMDADGKMTVRSELDDAAQYEEILVKEDKKPEDEKERILSNR
ncbi:MAG: hypothetical protein DWQ37_07020 [Planctomycetota bacterium]|nr:MAG: hypothetical protein DWQ37_07020 [Planctomycetota bacterium]